MSTYVLTTVSVIMHSLRSYFYKPLQFFKEIGIPGPKPKPLIGNLDLIRKCNVSLVLYVAKYLNPICLLNLLT